MGKALNRVTGGVCAGIVALGLWGVGVELDSDPELTASTATGTFSVHCIVPDSVVFVPELTYTLLPQSSPLAGASCRGSLLGAVNGQGDVAARCHWTSPEKLTVVHATPVMKLAGLQCKDVTSTELQVHLDPLTNTHTVAITSPHRPSRDADILAAGKSVTLFGLQGRIATLPLRDGRDLDQRLNGEIAFGGDSPATGGSVTTVEWASITTPMAISPQLHFVFTAH